MQLAPDMMVTQNVRLVSLIGEGAMGCVWLAEHETLHTRVAVKFIAEDLAREQPELLVRFRQEAAASAQIKSPYVVQTFDHGVTPDGTPYIVMEYLEGEGLGVRMRRQGRISMGQTVQVVVQVGKALDRAHEQGIIHRDIKPDNIFLSTIDDGMMCRVLDFGIAKHTKRQDDAGVTLPGTTVGTPEYMSREMVMLGADADAQTDLWALAVVAYEALTGKLPFAGPNHSMVCIAICNGEFAPPSSLRDDLPAGLDGWFERAFHKDPRQRFSSGKEMALGLLRLIPREEAQEFDAMIQTGQFSLPPPSSNEAVSHAAVEIEPFPAMDGAALHGTAPAPPTASRRRSLGVIAVLTVVILGVAGVAFWRLSSAHPDDASVSGPGSAAAADSPNRPTGGAASDIPSSSSEATGGLGGEHQPDAGPAGSSDAVDVGAQPDGGRLPGRGGSKGKRRGKDLGF